MAAIELADGKPYFGSVVAAVDESTRIAGAGVYYLICSAIIIDPHEVRQAIQRVIGHRTRSFHYSQEGANAISAMVDLIVDWDISASCRWRSIGRRKQAGTRPELLRSHLPDLRSSGVTHLIIEAGEASSNQSDNGVLLDYFRREGRSAFAYDWRSKHEPLLWVADAVCGIVGDHLTGKRHGAFEQLSNRGAIEVCNS
ncbi:MAG: hypothetical protein OXH23_13495 [bacterium]|nr:hypothetical protein [bacterium]